ncbi:MAG: helix-turn-helix transcriptional regulator [Lentisphaeria bacterium]|nr:helix-turn-helix transcriptional regulator [Lentisphaeria bacterium]
MKPRQPINNSVPVEKVIPDNMAQLFLPLYLKHPAVLKLRDAGILMAGISEASTGFRLRRTPDFLFVLFTRSGCGEIVVDGDVCGLEAGSVYFAPAGREQLYYQKGSGCWRFLWFHLKPAAAFLQPLPPGAVTGHFGDSARLEEAMSGFAAETVRSIQSLVSSDEQPPWNFYRDSMNLSESLRSFHLEPGASNRNAESLAGLYAELIFGLLDRAFLSLLARFDGDECSDRLERLWNRVLADLGREWPLEEMASIVHMSIPTLIRQVKKRYDATPMQMLYHLRLKRAVQLLLSSRLPVTAIAREIGYGSVSSFSTAFRAEYGVTPRDYRRRQPDGGPFS